MAKTQRLGKNSIIALSGLAGSVSDDVPLPDGVILRSEEEMVIWRQFTHARAQGDWRDFDLVIVAKAVRLEADIRKYQLDLDADGPIVTNDRGTPIVNPLLSIIDSLQRQQLSLLRSLSLSQTPTDPRTKNGAGQSQHKFRSLIKEHESLIPGT